MTDKLKKKEFHQAHPDKADEWIIPLMFKKNTKTRQKWANPNVEIQDKLYLRFSINSLI
jgi:hypothetical protein